MAYQDFITRVHTKTTRTYLERVERGDKAECAEVARQFGKDYWDGDRRHGYGGYVYDGRWAPVAEEMAAHYGLTAGDAVLDVGCGKGFLLYEFTQAVPGVTVRGIDVSRYGLEHAKPEVREFLDEGTAARLPYEDDSFDLVVSLNALHNLYLYDLISAIREIERVSKGASYIVVESYRNEAEKANLQHWQLTCEAYYRPEEWEYLYEMCGYTGDYSFIFFE